MAEVRALDCDCDYQRDTCDGSCVPGGVVRHLETEPMKADRHKAAIRTALDAAVVACEAAQVLMARPTRCDIAIIIRDTMTKDQGWLQYLPAADKILEYWDICEKNEANLKRRLHVAS